MKPAPAYLITGATGFLGRRLLRRLLQSGGQVIVLARGKRGAESRGGSVAQRVADLLRDLGCEDQQSQVAVIEADLTAPGDRSQGVICDQTIVLDGFYSAQDYPAHLRRIRFKDPKTGKQFVFLTNEFKLPALTIAALYKSRWQVELFFKWIKQHLRIKRFFGTSENAVKTQIWIAVVSYVLVAIIKKRLNLEVSLHTHLHILSVTAFEKTPITQAFLVDKSAPEMLNNANQLNLFPP